MPDTSAYEPIENWAWKAMDPADRDALRPRAIRRHLPKGDVLNHTHDEVSVVYFPVTADLANVVRLPDGAMGMATTVGRDGLTGLAAFLADDPIGWDVQVQLAGFAWAVPTADLRARYEASRPLRDQLLALTHQNQIEAALNVVCNVRHDATQRLSRWLLTTQDRTGLSEFLITQEELAELLGVRRSTLVETSRALVRDGVLKHRRGRMIVVSRDGLKQKACSCYHASHQP